MAKLDEALFSMIQYCNITVCYVVYKVMVIIKETCVSTGNIYRHLLEEVLRTRENRNLECSVLLQAFSKNNSHDVSHNATEAANHAFKVLYLLEACFDLISDISHSMKIQIFM